MAGLKFYYDLMSQPARAVFMFLKATNIPFVANKVILRKVYMSGDNSSEEYAKVNPFKMVPAIDDNGFKLSESVAILKYLADKYQVADHWYPKDLQQRARVDCFMSWQHLNIRLGGLFVFRIQFVGQQEKGELTDIDNLEKFQNLLEKSLDQMENIFLANQPYLCGPDISIGDMLGICELMQPVVVGYDVFANRPKLEAWATRVEDRLNPHFDEAHKIIYLVRDQFNPQCESVQTPVTLLVLFLLMAFFYLIYYS